MSFKTFFDTLFTPRQQKLVSWSIVTMIFVAALFVIGKFLIACLTFVSEIISGISY